MPAPIPTSQNFAFLEEHDPRLVVLASQAEFHFSADPAASLIKLRTFSEFLARRAAALAGIYGGPADTQAELVSKLFDRNLIGPLQKKLFHDLRTFGNAAAHENQGSHGDALHQLKMAQKLAVWFHQTFGRAETFSPGPFVPPSSPKQADPALEAELKLLRDEMNARAQELIDAQKHLEAEQARRLSAEQKAQLAIEEAGIWEALGQEQSELYRAEIARLNQELASVQAMAAAQSEAQKSRTQKRAEQASNATELDEAATRRLIDAQLRAAGWEADTQHLRFANGTRPVHGRNLAIAEWPTENPSASIHARRQGRADYMLFVGLTAVAVVEAKRIHKDISQVIPQAEDYSLGYQIQGQERLHNHSPWGKYKIPFVFATNGRPFLRQLLTKSGIWFRDVRRSQNIPSALEGFYTPHGLLERLKQDPDEAHRKLKTEAIPSITREYQQKAIRAVEQALEQGRREILLAMATGTGKTLTCIALCYRLLKTNRFRRILFLVDRNALGVQMTDALKHDRLDQMRTFHETFAIKELGEPIPDADTRFQIATVQAMVKRVLGPHGDADTAQIPPVDQYDCIIVDECHRGYLLDRELSEREFIFRDEADYISKYRRVLDHFDAYKIGLTATPAQHTAEIFGAPIFYYTYEEAVIDGYLVDYEPPIRIITQLAKDGIHFEAQEEAYVLDRSTQQIQLRLLPDEISFDVDAFHRRVITENWNRAVLCAVARELDPEGHEKTLIFCVNDEHADLAVQILKEEFTKLYGQVDSEAIQKITGQADRPLEKIRRFRTERLPNIAVTVDLLTTGVDIKSICNLVFLRRVKSRILYQQMLGRATRPCADIHKERFRIFDAVDLFASFQEIDDMKPVVVNPLVTFEQLAQEIIEGKEDEYRDTSRKELLAKLQRKKQYLKDELLAQVEAAAEMELPALLRFLKTAPVGDIAAYLSEHSALIPLLDKSSGLRGSHALISHHPDQVIDYGRGYGEEGRGRPADYLNAFQHYLQNNLNKIPALLVIAQRPRDLTREDLRSLKLKLNEAGFSEAHLQSALREEKNEDIAATIIGYIRRFALGSPLVPYGERVDGALRRLRKRHTFTAPQDKWLQRIGEQLKAETVVDRASLDRGQFQQAGGGFERLNKVFEGKLEMLLGELCDEVWKDVV